MKTKLLVIFLILTANLTFAQGWDMFVLNQNSYYKQQYADSAIVENFLVDSIITITDCLEIYIFNCKSKLKPECYDQNKREYPYIFNSRNSFKIDTLVKLYGYYYYSIAGSGYIERFYFNPKAKLNESWETKGITIKCMKLGVSDILGTQDSIKTFTCSGNGYDTIEFVLSKSHGFIKFLPLVEFMQRSGESGFPPYFELIGYTNECKSVGYTPPDFNKYFHLNAGDRLFWCNKSQGYGEPDPEIGHYSVDSIISSSITSNQVHYDIEHTLYNEDGSVYDIYYYSDDYWRTHEGIIVKSNISSFGIIERYRNWEIFYLESFYFKVEDGDTVTHLFCDLPQCFIDTSDCDFGCSADYHLKRGFSTREGIDFKYLAGIAGISTENLIGSIIDGVKKGVTHIATETNDTVYNAMNELPNVFQDVFPNPFHNSIIIKSKSQAISQIEIYDALGNLIIKQKTNTNKIDTEKLTQGLYILKVTDKSNTVRQIKIIKQ